MTVILDAQMMKMRTDAFIYLQEKLALPEHFGKNLDALYDCLTEVNDMTIVVEHAEDGGDFFEKIRRVMKDAQRDNENLTVEFV